MFIDTHAHLNFPDFDRDFREVFDRARDKGVTKIINVGTDLPSSRRTIEIAKDIPRTFPTVGLHPSDAKQWGEDKEFMKEFMALARDERVVAIGEVGLDFYRPNYLKGQQIAVFSAFLDIAEEVKKPLIIHCREAYEETLKILANRTLSGVVHVFQGDESVAKKLLDLGLHLSFAANVTYAKNFDHYAALLPKLPLGRILLETDCPFLPPEGERGSRNEPKNVVRVAETIGEILKKDPEEIGEITARNAEALFSI